LNYYRPSGEAPLHGVLVTVIFGGAAGAVLGALYAFINHHDPLVYLNVLLMFGFGSALGWIVSFGIRRFHIRNVYVAAVSGFLVFLAAYLSHWYFYLATVYVDRMTDSSFDVVSIFTLALAFMESPKGAWEFLKYLNEEGVWTISRSAIEIKGIVLSVLWVAELAAICFLAVKTSIYETCKPYSERRGEWIKSVKLIRPRAFIEDVEGFKAAMARGDYALLSALYEAEDEKDEGAPVDSKFATIELYPDPYESYIIVDNVTVKIERKKKKKKESAAKTATTTTNVVTYLKIPPAVADEIQKL
jgi:hypothetical protein